jgi:hypothetical protein
MCKSVRDPSLAMHGYVSVLIRCGCGSVDAAAGAWSCSGLFVGESRAAFGDLAAVDGVGI